MTNQIAGVHHITAISGDPQPNIDFYSGVLGMRFIKQTVNQDDPFTYHLYYGDSLGRPGSVMTFFPWPGARRGKRGVGQVTAVPFSIPEDAVDYWMERFAEHAIDFSGPTKRFDETVLSLRDPDGLELELVTNPDIRDFVVWEHSIIPGEYAIRGFYGATITLKKKPATENLIGDVFGFQFIGSEGSRHRFKADSNSSAATVDLVELPDAPFGQVAVGSVHHIAWRVPDVEGQEKWRQKIAGLGFQVTPIIDRFYFQSIYFRERGGVLFEIATDGPGFAVDEPEDQLGNKLVLPPW
nr:ring-cleaving dioxygenase [Candidatus Saccharibacteria bacterium]NIW79793.1 ring-cleaving dioxygenase [Calditrichia bacterium]